MISVSNANHIHLFAIFRRYFPELFILQVYKPFINSFQSYFIRYKCWSDYFSARGQSIYYTIWISIYSAKYVKSILKLFNFMYYCNHLHRLMGRNENYLLFLRAVTVVYFTDQNRFSKTIFCIRCVIVCKIGFPIWNAKIALFRASMVVAYYAKLFQMGADREKGVLMSLLLLVAETKRKKSNI